MAPPSLPPRGWYPDPGGSAAWRWWDGERWTDDLEPYATWLQQSALPAFEAEEHAAASFLPLGIGVLVAACLVRALVGSVDLPNTAEFRMEAKLGSTTHGVLSNEYLDENAKTTHYDCTIKVDRESFSYDETTVYEHYLSKDPIMHTDRNTLKLVSRDA